MPRDRCAEYEVFKRADAAFRRGDLAELRAALGDPPDFPNCRGPEGIGCSCLQYAIYHSPVSFIEALLEVGADPNYDDGDGFPSLIAALSAASTGGQSRRSDAHQLLELLLTFGADVHQRGINDYTPLHCAAAAGNVRAVELFLAHGADPNARTRVDDYETPLELAERGGQVGAAEVLRRVVHGGT
jgi:uncharacterized protein